MSNAIIHPTALVNPEARLGEGVEIGPFCIVGPHAEIGDGTKLLSHVIIDGHVKIGKNNTFYQFCSIGAPPQDLSYKNDPTRVEIGDNNVFREYVSIHRGTLKQDGVTIVGNNGFFMAHVHFAHDVVVEDNVICVNSVQLAGHAHIGYRCIIGGATSISQFVTLGKGSYIGGGSAIDRDVPNFCTAYGNRIKLKGINIIGLRRQGFDKPVISEVVDFFRTMESSALSPRSFVDHAELMEEYKDNKIVQEMSEFIRKSEIGIAPFMS